MEVGVLGPLVLTGPDGAPTPVPGRRRRALLAALVAHRGRTVAADVLVDALWPDDPPSSARHGLHSHVSRLRQDHAAPVAAADGGYRLTLPEGAVDADRFDRLVAHARTAAPADAVGLLEDALALWRGPAFGSSSDLVAVRGEAQRLTEARHAARESLCRALVGTGRAGAAVGHAEQLVGELPARESAWLVLVETLVAAGRPADGVAAYARATAALDELGLLPSAALRRAHEAALRAPLVERAPARAPESAPHAPRVSGSIPVPPTSLVGRDADLAAVAEALDGARLVTLVGPGGVGKTRLALEVARRRADRHASGVRVVELTTLDDVAAVPAAVVGALGVHTLGGPVGPALRRAGDLDVLVVLDNCEHVVDAVAEVLEDLLAGGRARVLATSREPVGLAGEHVVPLAPLPTTADSAAHRLFVDRAVAAGVPGGADALNPQLVDRVVRRLDGLPLAIEMAAARTATLGLTDLVHRLEGELGPVGLHDGRRRGVAERHRTLRAVIAWSEALLEPDEHDALVRWPVFSGPVESQDAHAVLGAEPGVVESLVRRSLLLLVADADDGRSRYRMLHTVRSAVRPEGGPPVRDRERHAAHVRGVVDEADRLLRTPAEPRAVSRLTSLVAELRSAHAWLREHDPGAAARLSRGLHVHATSTLDDEVLGWAALLVPLVADDDARATAHTEVAVRLVKAGEPAAAVRHAELALGLARDAVGRLQALEVLTDAPIYDGGFDECRRWSAELGALALEHGDVYYATQAAVSAVLVRTYEGHAREARDELDRRRRDLERRFGDLSPSCDGWLEFAAGEAAVEDEPDVAVAALDRAVRLADAAGNRYLGGVARVSASSVRGRHGDPGAAVPAFVDVVRWWLDRADRMHLVTTLRNLVDLLVRLEEWRAAAELLGAVRTPDVSRTFGPEERRLTAAAERVAHRLGGGEAADATARGAARTLEDAARAALVVLTGGT